MIDREALEQAKADAQAIYEWLREPDFAEFFGNKELADWLNRRPSGKAKRLSTYALTALASQEGAQAGEVATAAIPTQKQMNEAFYVDVCRAETRLKEFIEASRGLLDSLPNHWHDSAVIDLRDLCDETEAVISPVNQRHQPEAFLVRARANYGAASVIPTTPPAPDEAVQTAVEAFRNADDEDWLRLFDMIDNSGHGRFWKAVFNDFLRARKGGGEGSR